VQSAAASSAQNYTAVISYKGVPTYTQKCSGENCMTTRISGSAAPPSGVVEIDVEVIPDTSPPGLQAEWPNVAPQSLSASAGPPSIMISENTADSSGGSGGSPNLISVMHNPADRTAFMSSAGPPEQSWAANDAKIIMSVPNATGEKIASNGSQVSLTAQNLAGADTTIVLRSDSHAAMIFRDGSHGSEVKLTAYSQQRCVPRFVWSRPQRARLTPNACPDDAACDPPRKIKRLITSLKFSAIISCRGVPTLGRLFFLPVENILEHPCSNPICLLTKYSPRRMSSKNARQF
jgi:hypothetical protein